MLLDRGVHRIGSKVQITGPRHGTVIKLDLCKQGWVGKSGEYPGLGRMHQARHIDSSGEAIGKGDPQAEPPKGFDGGDTPRRSGGDLAGQGSGRIFIGA